MPSLSRALNRIKELNQIEQENYKKENLRYEKEANRCKYCKTRFIKQEQKKNCRSCGAMLPEYEWPIAPPMQWTMG